MIQLLGLYLKLNILLAVSLLVWAAIRQAARMLGFEISSTRQLVLARVLFLVMLLIVPLFRLALNWQPLLLDWLQVVPGAGVASELAVSASIDEGLRSQYGATAEPLSPAWLLLGLLLTAWLIRAVHFHEQWSRLKFVVDHAVPWKTINGVRLMLTTMVASPFSTRAVGHRHIILPCHLLASPKDLRIAIRHELQHLRSGDLNWVILLEGVKLACFWNPAAYAWYQEFDSLQEYACDEVLIRGRRRVSPYDYGSSLLKVAAESRREELPAAASMVPCLSSLWPRQSRLRRRIVNLYRPASQCFTTLKAMVYVTLFSGGLLAVSLVVVAGSPLQRQEHQPLRTVKPVYPREALARGLVGWVEVEFSIDEEGRIFGAVVRDSCVASRDHSAPDCIAAYSQILDPASLAALGGFQYRPARFGGEPVQSHGVRYRFDYRMQAVNMDIRINWASL